MELQDNIISLVSLVAGFGTLGAILDQLLLTKDTKQSLNKFLKNRATEKVSTNLFFDFLEIVNNSVFL